MIENLRTIFDHIDESGDGIIDMGELREALDIVGDEKLSVAVLL
jgi:Ca2+-binding EF-hand superfamily protein